MFNVICKLLNLSKLLFKFDSKDEVDLENILAKVSVSGHIGYHRLHRLHRLAQVTQVAQVAQVTQVTQVIQVIQVT